MANSYFQFKEFTIHQDRCAMKVTTDACLFGAWVAERIRHIEPKANTVLDIGTGTGLLSLMLAQKNPSLKIDAVEIDNDAAIQASENILASPWTGNITIHNGDIKNYDPNISYDIIISNPPFYEKEIKSIDSKRNAAHHGDSLLITEVFQLIKKLLPNTGRYYVLLPYKRKEEITAILKQEKLHPTNIVFIRQSNRHDFFRIMLEGEITTGKEAPASSHDITIRNTTANYTPAFSSLLQDYYL